MITIKQFGGRKFILSFFLIFTTFLLVIFGKLSADNFMQIALATLAVYAGANAYLSKTESK